MDLMDEALIEKCRQVEEELSRAWGDFTLFGLFEREETAGQWDIVVSAPWLSVDIAGIRRVVDALAPLISKAAWFRITGVVPLKAESGFVRAVTRRVHTQHGLEQVSNTSFEGVFIDQAYIITADAAAARHVENKVAVEAV